MLIIYEINCIVGTVEIIPLQGHRGDIFDSDAGGDDRLHGTAVMTPTGWDRDGPRHDKRATIKIAAMREMRYG